MQDSTRTKLLVGIVVCLVLLVGVWWYFGFSLGFMRFFAAEPGVDNTGRPGQSAPPGCYYQEVQCIQAPCPPQLVCPSCQPRPACLDAVPSCDIAEPADGWCPPTGRGIVTCTPATQTIQVSEAATLRAAGGNGQYEWFAPDGSLNNFGPTGGAAVPGTASVKYTTTGTKKVTVQSGRSDGSNTVDSVACSVIVVP